MSGAFKSGARMSRTQLERKSDSKIKAQKFNRFISQAMLSQHYKRTLVYHTQFGHDLNGLPDFSQAFAIKSPKRVQAKLITLLLFPLTPNNPFLLKSSTQLQYSSASSTRLHGKGCRPALYQPGVERSAAPGKCPVNKSTDCRRREPKRALPFILGQQCWFDSFMLYVLYCPN
jgi:hypothetical protein